MSSLQALQETSRLSRPPTTSSLAATKGGFTKLLRDVAGISISGLQVWVDLGELKENSSPIITIYSPAGLGSSLFVDLDIESSTESRHRQDGAGSLELHRSNSFQGFESIQGVVRQHSKSCKPTGAMAADQKRTTEVEGSRYGSSKRSSDRARLLKANEEKRVRFCNYDTFLSISSEDTDEGNFSDADISYDYKNEDDLCQELHCAVGYQSDVVGPISSPVEIWEAKWGRSYFHEAQRCQGAIHHDGATELDERDEIYDVGWGQPQNGDTMEKPALLDVNPEKLDAVEMSAVYELLKLKSNLSDDESEKHSGHRDASALSRDLAVNSEVGVTIDEDVTDGREGSAQAREMTMGQCDLHSEFDNLLDAKLHLEELSNAVEHLYAQEPSLSWLTGIEDNEAGVPSWSIEVSEDARKLTLRNRKGFKRAKRNKTASPSANLDGSILSDDLEPEDDIFGRPVWRRQFKSVNALVS